VTDQQQASGCVINLFLPAATRASNKVRVFAYRAVCPTRQAAYSRTAGKRAMQIRAHDLPGGKMDIYSDVIFTVHAPRRSSRGRIDGRLRAPQGVTTTNRERRT